ncbi:MAG: PTS fructose transporter subunit IIC [Phycisphaerales bacterium]|nr:PTS fructose transporter subunit IIC [Phycisphaerales bacterium]
MEALKKLRQHLLTGVSFAIPFIACGGILIALSLAFAPVGPGGPDVSKIENSTLRQVLSLTLQVGVTSFNLMLPILAGYIAYSIAGKPGLVPGMIGGLLSGHVAEISRPVDVTAIDGTVVQVMQAQAVSAGFLGALVAGLLAGYLVYWIKKVPTHKLVKPIMPILIVPAVSSVIIGVIMLKVVGPPIAGALTDLGHWLEAMQQGSKVLLAMILGAMIAFDMGGPVNKAAFFFAAGLIANENPNYQIMGAVAAAICTPPLGMGLATFLARKLWREEERESGLAAFGMGMIGITEGAIPFAAADPLRVIPCIVLGSMTASTVAMLSGVGDHAPHGGPIVMFVVDNKLMYLVAIAIGTVVTALAINTLKKLTKPAAGAAAA